MGINIEKILEQIKKDGVEKTLKKIKGYKVNGPTAEEMFGKEAVDHVEKEISKNKE